MQAYQSRSIGQRAHRTFQRREVTPFLYNINEHVVSYPGLPIVHCVDVLPRPFVTPTRRTQQLRSSSRGRTPLTRSPGFLSSTGATLSRLWDACRVDSWISLKSVPTKRLSSSKGFRRGMRRRRRRRRLTFVRRWSIRPRLGRCWSMTWRQSTRG